MAKDYKVNVTIDGQDNASKVLGGVGNEFAKQLGYMGAAATAALATFKGMTIAADFEQQMSYVKAVAQATGPEFEALKRKAVELGNTTVYTAAQVGQAMEELAKAGLTPQQVLEATGDTLLLAAAGGLDLADAARIAAQALNIFNLQATELGHVADVLALAAAKTATDVGALGDAYAYVGPIASALGMSLEDTTAALAMMSKAGIDGSMAGTSLRNIMMNLVNPTNEAKKAFEALGVNVVDTSGKMLPFQDILSQFNPEIVKTAEGMKHINTIFGERGAPGFISLVNQGTEAFVGFRDSLKNADGPAREMAETRLDNLKGSLTILWSVLQTLAITLFGGGERSFGDALRTVIEQCLIPAVQGVTQLINILNPLGEVTSLVAKEFLSMVDFGSSFLSSIAVAVVAFNEFIDGISRAVLLAGKALWEPIKAPFEVIMGVIKNVFVETVNWWGAKITSAANMLFEPIRAALDKLGIHIGEFKWTPLTTEPAQSMNEAWSAAVTKMETGLAEAKGQMSNTFLNLRNESIVVFDEMKNSFDGKITGPAGLAATTKKAANDAVKNAGDALIGTPGLAGGGLPGVTQEAVEAAGVSAGLAGVQIPKAIEPHIEAVKTKFGELPSALEMQLNLMKASVEKAGLGDKIAWAMKQGWDDYLKAVPGIQESVITGMQGIASTMERTISGGFQSIITSGHVDFVGGMKAVGEAAAKALGDTLSAEVMRRLIGPAVNAIIDMFSGGFSSVISSAGNMANSLGSTIGGATGGGGGISALGGTLGGLAGFGTVLAAGYGLVKLIDSFMPESKTIEEQIEQFKSKNAIQTDEDLMRTLLTQLNNPYLNQYGSTSAGTLQIGLYKRVYDALSEAQKGELLNAGGYVTRWAKSLAAGAWNYTGAGSALITPKFHLGGMIPGEGLFLGLSGEGILNRRATERIGESGLAALNEGRGVGETYVFVIHAMDGEDVERVLDKKIIPMIREKSEAGITVIHENGVKHAS